MAKRVVESDGRLVKIVGDILQNARDLAEWGLETRNLTQDDLRMEVVRRNPELRLEAAQKLIDSGMSQRAVARVLGVDHATIQRDLARNAPKSGAECATQAPTTNSPATKARRAAVAEKAAAAGVTEAPEADKYRIIYADPPWSYGNTQPDYHTEQRDHYPVMELADICALEVSEWVEDDAVLFLWTTSPILQDAFKVIRAWGFEYKSSFVWDKVKHNMGHYNSVRHEFLLVCTRGSCQPDAKRLFDSVYTEERTEHSVKPAHFRVMIEAIYTSGRRLEMFARSKRKGWDRYGHEAEVRDVAAE
jgi:N6-adenosine-specific RNA methylase IME4/predicted transcriptional regulator